MSEPIEKLVKLGGKPLSTEPALFDVEANVKVGARVDELREMLTKKNGFYAFESALHVFPSKSTGSEVGLSEWNSTSVWRYAYQGTADAALYFAEDVFGVQFALKDGGVFTFDPELGEFGFFAASLSQWATLILQNYELHSGYPLAHEWQKRHGAIPPGHRLIPKIPFCVGGEFSVENMHLLPSTKAMVMRADMAVQLKNAPDGTSVRLKIVD
jgi:hypothetical protein